MAVAVRLELHRSNWLGSGHSENFGTRFRKYPPFGVVITTWPRASRVCQSCTGNRPDAATCSMISVNQDDVEIGLDVSTRTRCLARYSMSPRSHFSLT